MMFDKLKELREYELKTQNEIAGILKVQRSTYAGWETGKDVIPLRKLNLFANHFHTSMDYLAGLSAFESVKSEMILDPILSAEFIKAFRAKNDITQQELANVLNTSQSNIHRYESGTHLITTNYAYLLAKKYHVSLDRLSGRK